MIGFGNSCLKMDSIVDPIPDLYTIFCLVIHISLVECATLHCDP